MTINVTARGVAHIGKLMACDRGELALTLPCGATLQDLLIVLVKSCGPAFEQGIFQQGSPVLRDDVRLLLNGREITFLNGLATELRSGDHLSLIPPLAGG